jgi:hypothetical protein
MGKYNVSEILQLVETKDLLIAPEKFCNMKGTPMILCVW